MIFVEHRLLHGLVGPVPEAPYTVPFGRARVLAEGGDVTIVGVSYMAVEALRARTCLARAGIAAEVIDPVSLSPLDMDTIEVVASQDGPVARRRLGVDELRRDGGDRRPGGRSASRAARRAPRAAARLRARACARRRGRSRTSSTRAPGPIAAAAHALVHGGPERWEPGDDAPDPIEFKGPF